MKRFLWAIGLSCCFALSPARAVPMYYSLQFSNGIETFRVNFPGEDQGGTIVPYGTGIGALGITGWEYDGPMGKKGASMDSGGATVDYTGNYLVTSGSGGGVGIAGSYTSNFSFQYDGTNFSAIATYEPSNGPGHPSGPMVTYRVTGQGALHILGVPEAGATFTLLALGLTGLLALQTARRIRAVANLGEAL